LHRKNAVSKVSEETSHSFRYCNSLAVHLQLPWSEHQGMRTHAQLRSAATETNSSQPLRGSNMSLISSEDHYSRHPVQGQSSNNAMFTVTSNANTPFCGVIKLDMGRQPPSWYQRGPISEQLLGTMNSTIPMFPCNSDVLLRMQHVKLFPCNSEVLCRN
jgi:hypothetical protein